MYSLRLFWLASVSVIFTISGQPLLNEQVASLANQNVQSSQRSTERPAVPMCLKNEAAISHGAFNIARKALLRYEKQLNVKLEFTCESPLPVVVSFKHRPADGQPSDALGATRVSGGRILPDIEIFCSVVRSYLKSPSLVDEGRAYAAVAVHELRHYVMQRTAHGGGLDSEFLSGSDLLRAAK